MTECNWKDPEDIAEIRRVKAIRRRMSKVPQDGLCPLCGRPVVFSGSWVLKGDPCCRSCYHRRVKTTLETFNKDMILAEHVRYEMDHEVLVEARTFAGLSQREFAKQAGWTRSYQRKLETGGFQTVTDETMDVIFTVLAKFGTKCLGTNQCPPE